MRTIPSTSWLHLLVVLCSLNTLLDAYDVSQEKPALGPLGVTLDYPLAIAFPDFQDPNNANVPRNWAWSSHFEFAQPVSTITDGQLWSMALDAYKEMVADAKQYGVGNRNRPGAMSVLAFGNELIFASSQKGRTSFSYTYANTPVLHSLRLCQAVVGPGEGQEHKNGGSCGEVMAVQLYYTRHPTPPLSSLGARIATIVLQNVRGGPVAPLPAVPCGDFTNGRVSRVQSSVVSHADKVVILRPTGAATSSWQTTQCGIWTSTFR